MNRLLKIMLAVRMRYIVFGLLFIMVFCSLNYSFPTNFEKDFKLFYQKPLAEQAKIGQSDVLTQAKSFNQHQNQHKNDEKYTENKMRKNEQTFLEIKTASEPPHSGKYEQPDKVKGEREKDGLNSPKAKKGEIDIVQDDGHKVGSSTKPKNVYFAKTHKAASTTIQNILFRYGEKYNLTFAMPWDINRAGYPNHFTPEVIIPLAHGYKEYNIFCHHTRYHQRITNFMPRDTLYIGTVRSVESQFLSGYIYHKVYNCFRTGKDNITQILKVMLKNKHGRQCGPWKVSAQSEQIYDFGFEIKDMLNVTMIKEYIQFLDNAFDYIFVADYFYESLVLLADILKVPLGDMVYVRLNQVQRYPELNKQDVKMLKEWNVADYMLFDYFNQSFWRRVEIYGTEKLYRNVETLKQLQNTTTLNCTKNSVNSQCELMKLAETKFTQDLKLKMIFEERLNAKIASQIKFNTKWPGKSNQRNYPFHSRAFKERYFKNCSRVRYLSEIKQIKV
ncbi:unnamed protein product [Owenia fusiformis]|uniref:Galactose-3-O-sulfotransferase 2-like n=1 Tax=Owenia fusiformis TaxID=6347 RepID=A0A8S4NMJ2_OWEFU|nr:unnamed protein product [Owenia fusiformis]